MLQTTKKITFVEIVEKLNISTLPSSYASYVDWYNEAIARETRLSGEFAKLLEENQKMKTQIIELKKEIAKQNNASCKFVKLQIATLVK